MEGKIDNQINRQIDELIDGQISRIYIIQIELLKRLKDKLLKDKNLESFNKLER